eukprot:11645185-Ditylum_brightwellii.AAC.1
MAQVLVDLDVAVVDATGWWGGVQPQQMWIVASIAQFPLLCFTTACSLSQRSLESSPHCLQSGT